MNILTLFFLVSCNQVGSKNNSPKPPSNSNNLKNTAVGIDSTRIKDSIRMEEELIRSNLILGQKYSIKEERVIQKEPNINSEKLINKKASEIFDKTIYASVDKSTKVLVEDIKGLWAKIRIVEPEWLKTHEGWIMASNIIGENKTDRYFISNLNKSFLVSLLENINKKQFIDNTLKKLNFHEESNGLYKSNEEIANKPKHIINVNDLTDMVVMHSSDTIFWKKVTKELKGIQKQEAFQEGSYSGRRYIDGKITFETFTPKNGINIAKNIFYDLYVYKTRSIK